MVLLGVGLIAGRAGRPAPPPLIIERHTPLSNDQSEKADPQSEPAGEEKGAPIEEAVYLCGARTKKGTACSRRVHGPVRCWQHKGMRPMLPQDKLAVKE